MGLTRTEAALVRRLSTPAKVQAWLDTLTYNYEGDGRPTLRTLHRVIRDRTAHCLEGALAAAAILRTHGYPPHLVCIEARDVDHNLFVYRRGGRWGSVAQSRDPHLKGRAPTHRKLKDLVMSYYPFYWNLRTGDETDLSMRGYASVDLSRFEVDWVTADEDPRAIEEHLYAIEYRALFPREGRRFYVSTREEKIIWVR
ncbi:MAG: hypothetical protein HYZ28_14040 [Myxococcales bacterium]|nr:hypothetical protein [Myxococcales bacterium]